jgi:hypothetical protein
VTKPLIQTATVTVTTVTAKTETLTLWMHHNGLISIEMGTETIQKEQLLTAVHPSMVSRSKTDTDAQMEIWTDTPILMRVGHLSKALMHFHPTERSGQMVMETAMETML